MALDYIRKGEDRYKVFKLHQKIKEKEDKEEKEKELKLKKLHLPKIKGKMTYKSGNPLKKLLSHKKRATIKVGGY